MEKLLLAILAAITLLGFRGSWRIGTRDSGKVQWFILTHIYRSWVGKTKTFSGIDYAEHKGRLKHILDRLSLLSLKYSVKLESICRRLIVLKYRESQEISIVSMRVQSQVCRRLNNSPHSSAREAPGLDCEISRGGQS